MTDNPFTLDLYELSQSNETMHRHIVSHLLSTLCTLYFWVWDPLSWPGNDAQRGLCTLTMTGEGELTLSCDCDRHPNHGRGFVTRHGTFSPLMLQYCAEQSPQNQAESDLRVWT